MRCKFNIPYFEDLIPTVGSEAIDYNWFLSKEILRAEGYDSHFHKKDGVTFDSIRKHSHISDKESLSDNVLRAAGIFRDAAVQYSDMADKKSPSRNFVFFLHTSANPLHEGHISGLISAAQHYLEEELGNDDDETWGHNVYFLIVPTSPTYAITKGLIQSPELDPVTGASLYKNFNNVFLNKGTAYYFTHHNDKNVLRFDGLTANFGINLWARRRNEYNELFVKLLNDDRGGNHRSSWRRAIFPSHIKEHIKTIKFLYWSDMGYNPVDLLYWDLMRKIKAINWGGGDTKLIHVMGQDLALTAAQYNITAYNYCCYDPIVYVVARDPSYNQKQLIEDWKSVYGERFLLNSPSLRWRLACYPTVIKNVMEGELLPGCSSSTIRDMMKRDLLFNSESYVFASMAKRSADIIEDFFLKRA